MELPKVSLKQCKCRLESTVAITAIKDADVMSVRHDQFRHFLSEYQYFGQKIELAQQGLRRGSDYVGFVASSITGSDMAYELASVNGSSFFQLG